MSERVQGAYKSREAERSSDWQTLNCAACGSQFIGKASDTCGLSQCEGSAMQFQTFKPAMRNPANLETVIDSFNGFFEESSTIKSVRAVPLKPAGLGNSLFTSSGSNIYNPYIFGNLKSPVFDAAAVAQPVVRLKSPPSSENGFVRSFTNLALARVDASPDEHEESQEMLFDWLSSNGIYIPDMTLHRSKEVENWGLGAFACNTTRLMYKGLELGVANYYPELPTARGSNIRYSDVSVGAERVNWAVAKTESFLPVVTPDDYQTSDDITIIDSHRTTTLGALSSGCSPASPTPQGSKMRQIAHEIAPNVPLDYELIQAYTRFWKRYISPREADKSPTDVFNEINCIIKSRR